MKTSGLSMIRVLGVVLLATASVAVAEPVITNAPGYVITWDGNEGLEGGSPSVPANIALASQGATAFASGELGVELKLNWHRLFNLNDGSYGNTKSWIGGSRDLAPWYAGIQLTNTVPLTGIAWGRDNTGVSKDRCFGTYTLQISTNASVSTNASAWITLGTITYPPSSAAGFSPWLRHRYQVADTSGRQIMARGVRLLVPDSGLSATGTAIDEIELFRSSVTDIAYWRMGENDPGAGNGVTSAATANLLGGVLSLPNKAVHTSDVAPLAHSALALRFEMGSYATNATIAAPLDHFGLELWVKPDATNAIQCLAYNGNSGPNGWGLYLYQGKYQGLFGGVSFLTGPDAVPGKWTHLALVRNNDTATLYVDGVASVSSKAVPILPVGRFALGVQAQTLNVEFFSGVLDEVRVFRFEPGAFSPAELLLPVQPPTAKTVAATDIGNSFGTIQGTVNPRNLATLTWFEWGTTTGYGNTAAIQWLAPTNVPLALSTPLNGLTIDTPIYYRVAASNVMGVSYGADANFTPSSFVAAPLPDLPQIACSSMSWGDYDNDGRLDFLITGAEKTRISQIWRNTGNGFVNVTDVAAPGLPQIGYSSSAWGDYDNDGHLDFLITGAYIDSKSILKFSQIWHNNGNGTFSDVTATAAPGLLGAFESAVAWADYDNDGDLDFLVAGDVGPWRISQLWRNNGNGTFSDVTADAAPGLPGLYQCSAAWGDYNNDGLLDFLLTGSTAASQPVVLQLRRNNGDGTFSDVSATVASDLPGVVLGKVVWVDYDTDGRLDLFLTGRGPSSAVSQLWRNTGGGFTNVPIPGLLPVLNSSVAWGDYDSDGQPDFVLSGSPHGQLGGVLSQLWRNTGNGFTQVLISNLPQLYLSSVASGDYDNDGRLDFLLSGSLGLNGPQRCQLWRNTLPVTNTPPSAPTGLAMTATTNAVMLSWNAATDEQTPADGLSYNVRAGTTPGGTDLLAGHVDASSGFRRVPAMGNAYLRHSRPLQGLTHGQTVYWSVQAVDTSFAGGPFATETSEVTIPRLVISSHSDPSTLSISWSPPTWGWTLQELGDLSTVDWIQSPSGALNPATVPATNGIHLYRLHRP